MKRSRNWLVWLQLVRWEKGDRKWGWTVDGWGGHGMELGFVLRAMQIYQWILSREMFQSKSRLTKITGWIEENGWQVWSQTDRWEEQDLGKILSSCLVYWSWGAQGKSGKGKIWIDNLDFWFNCPGRGGPVKGEKH